MKSLSLRIPGQQAFFRLCIIPTFVLAVASVAQAVDGTWSAAAATSYSWSSTANWVGGNVANGNGAIADLTVPQNGGTRTFNFDSQNWTLGNLTILNGSASGRNYTFASTSGGTLTFANNGSAAQLNTSNAVTTTTGTNAFSVPIFLADSLNINNASTVANAPITFSGTISASTSGTKIISNNSTGLGAILFLPTSGPTPATNIVDGAGVVGVRQNSATSTMVLGGTLTTNTYTGGTYIDAGILSVAADSNLGASSSSVFFNGGTMRTTAGINVPSSLRIIDVAANGGTIDTNGSFINWYGAITGTGTLYKTGGSVLSLNSTASTISGGISVLSGTLRVRNGDGAFGATSNGVTLANGTELLIQDVFTANAARTLTMTSGTVGMDIRANFGWQGVINGSASMLKIGTGILTLTGTNTYTGNTIINAGAVQIDSDLNLGDAASSVILNGGTLRVSNVGTATGLATARTLSLAGVGGAIQADKFVNWDGLITGSGVLSKMGSNTLSLNNANNDFVGNIQVGAGIFRIRGGDGSLGNANNDMTFANGTTFRVHNISSVVLTDLNANRSLTLDGTVTVDTLTALRVNGAIGGAGNLVKTGTGTFTAQGTGSYSGSTTVSEGTLLINGDFSAATGGFTVSAGATLGGTGTIGSSVGVLGTIGAGNSIGTLSVQSLTIGATGTLSAELGRNAGTPVNDVINVTGDVTLDGGANLSLTLYSGLDNPQIGDIFYLLNNDGGDVIAGLFASLNGVATDLSEGSTFTWNSMEWVITYQASFGTSFTGGNDLAIMTTAVPEPSTWALVGAGLALVLVMRRRRQRG